MECAYAMAAAAILLACGGRAAEISDGGERGGASSQSQAGTSGSPPASTGGLPPEGTAGNPPTSDSGAGGTPPISPEAEQLAALQKEIVGSWLGQLSTPAWGGPICGVKFAFRADGTYSAKSYAGDCIALYYGSDEDSPEKTYRLHDVTAAGEGQGDIAIWFGPGNTNAGTMRHVLCDGTHLTFEVFKGDYGPLRYELVYYGSP